MNNRLFAKRIAKYVTLDCFLRSYFCRPKFKLYHYYLDYEEIIIDLDVGRVLSLVMGRQWRHSRLQWHNGDGEC